MGLPDLIEKKKQSVNSVKQSSKDPSTILRMTKRGVNTTKSSVFL